MTHPLLPHRRPFRYAAAALAPILLITLLLAVGAAFAQDGSADDGAVAEGRSVYLSVAGMGCSACHGQYGLGDLGIGPNIRGVDAIRIRGALEAAEEMEFLAPILTDADVDALAAYLTHLGTLQPASAQFRQGVFEPAEIELPAGTRVQLILSNGNRTPCTLVVDAEGIEATEIEGRAVGAVTWSTPEMATDVQATCTEDPANPLVLRITGGM